MRASIGAMVVSETMVEDYERDYSVPCTIVRHAFAIGDKPEEGRFVACELHSLHSMRPYIWWLRTARPQHLDRHSRVCPPVVPSLAAAGRLVG